MTEMKRWLTVWSGLAFFASNLPARGPVTEQNVVVYKAAGRYGGWPANHGIWSWGNEILVGFEAGYFKFSDTRHSIDFDRPADVPVTPAPSTETLHLMRTVVAPMLAEVYPQFVEKVFGVTLVSS